MLEQLVECENRLLEEQRRFNELLLAWRSGDLGDDLTRMRLIRCRGKWMRWDDS